MLFSVAALGPEGAEAVGVGLFSAVLTLVGLCLVPFAVRRVEME